MGWVNQVYVCGLDVWAVTKLLLGRGDSGAVSFWQRAASVLENVIRPGQEGYREFMYVRLPWNKFE